MILPGFLLLVCKCWDRDSFLRVLQAHRITITIVFIQACIAKCPHFAIFDHVTLHVFLGPKSQTSNIQNEADNNGNSTSAYLIMFVHSHKSSVYHLNRSLAPNALHVSTVVFAFANTSNFLSLSNVCGYN